MAILGTGDFFGEGCLAGQPLRMASATVMLECLILRVEKGIALRPVHDQLAFSALMIHHFLSRNIRIEEDIGRASLQLQREASGSGALLLMANFGKESKPEPAIAKVSQETLAEIVGTTRSRVSSFMNRFRKLGYIEYSAQQTDGMEARNSLLNVICTSDRPPGLAFLNGQPIPKVR